MARQPELLQTRSMLSSVTFDSGTNMLDISLDGSDSTSAQVVGGQVEVSINGTPAGPTPDASDVYFISVTGGSGDNLIDLSSLTAADFSYLLTSTSISGGDGNDTIYGSGIMDDIRGESGADSIDGGGGSDNLYGDDGADVLNGGSDSDCLLGGNGDDTLWSGSGAPDDGTGLDGECGLDTLDGVVDESDECGGGSGSGTGSGSGSGGGSGSGNTAPQVYFDSLPGLTVGVGELTTVTGSAIDIDSDDVVTLTVDWGGDGAAPIGAPDSYSNVASVSGDFSWRYGGSGSYTITITATDDDGDTSSEVHVIDVLPTVSIRTTDPVANEETAEPGQFTVTRHGSHSAALTVSLAISGTATNGVDYLQLGSEGTVDVTIPASTSDESVTVDIVPIPDNPEGAEDVVLTINASSDYVTGQNPATVIISEILISAGGAYVVAPDADATLAGVAQDAADPTLPVTYSWDLTGDGIPDAFGNSPVITWDDLDLLGMLPSADPYSITLTATLGGVSVNANAFLTFLPAAVRPLVGVTGKLIAVENSAVAETINVEVEDTSPGVSGKFILTVYSNIDAPAGGIDVKYEFNDDGIVNKISLAEDFSAPEASTGTITIPAGQKVGQKVITVKEDNVVEGLEKIQFNLIEDTDEDGTGPDTDQYDVITRRYTVGNTPGNKVIRSGATLKILSGVTLFGRFRSDGTGEDSHDVDKNDIRQGSAADCYLHSTLLSIIDKDPDLVKGFFEVFTSLPIYRVKLHKYNSATGTFYVHYESVRPNLTRGFSQAYLSQDVDNKNNAEIWPQVLEQAFAQAYGGWRNIDFNTTSANSLHNPSTVYGMLFGKKPKVEQPANVSLQGLHDRLNPANNSDADVITFTTKSVSDTTGLDWNIGGEEIRPSHTYAVVDVDVAAETITIVEGYESSQGGPITVDYDELQQNYIHLFTILEFGS